MKVLPAGPANRDERRCLRYLLAMFKRLNPFAGLPNPREVWAWTMYDAAAQSFTLIINSVLFAVFFKDVIMAGDKDAEKYWSMMAGGSLLFVCLLAPPLGALADERGMKKTFLIIVGLICSLCTIGLGLLGAGHLWWAVALYMPANFAYGMSNVFLSAFLPQVANEKNMGRVSAIGWGSGYVASLVMLGASYFAMKYAGLDDPARWSPLIIGAGLWYMLLAIPTVIWLHEKRTVPVNRAGNPFVVAFGRLAKTAREASRFRQLLRFLIIFFIYNIAVQTVVYFSSLIIARFGVHGSELVLFMLPVSLFAGVGAVITGAVQDRIGHRTTVMAWLGVWSVNALAFLLVPKPADGSDAAPGVLWVVSCGLGLGLGGIGTAGRALVGKFTPADKTAEFFGLWGLMYKLGAVVGVGLFGFVLAAFGDRVAYSALAGLFILGLILMTTVDEQAGADAAKMIPPAPP